MNNDFDRLCQLRFRIEQRLGRVNERLLEIAVPIANRYLQIKSLMRGETYYERDFGEIDLDYRYATFRYYCGGGEYDRESVPRENLRDPELIEREYEAWCARREEARLTAENQEKLRKRELLAQLLKEQEAGDL